jgi:hypothetical protein
LDLDVRLRFERDERNKKATTENAVVALSKNGASGTRWKSD